MVVEALIEEGRMKMMRNPFWFLLFVEISMAIEVVV